MSIWKNIYFSPDDEGGGAKLPESWEEEIALKNEAAKATDKLKDSTKR